MARLDGIDTGKRTVRLLELLETGGWKVKLYGMSLGPAPPPSPLVDHARELIRSTLPDPRRCGSEHGVGFATIHAGESGDYLLVDWWESRDLLHHHLFGAARPHGGRLQYGWPRGVACCVWELAVAWHERNAWWRHVLSRPGDPDLQGYLEDRLEGTV